MHVLSLKYRAHAPKLTPAPTFHKNLYLYIVFIDPRIKHLFSINTLAHSKAMLKKTHGKYSPKNLIGVITVSQVMSGLMYGIFVSVLIVVLH